MNKKMPPVVDWSCRLYARLLAILPWSFRQDYDQPILQAFRDLSLAAWQTRGPLGLAYVWMHALPDLADGAAGEWQLALTFGGHMERVAVRTTLLMSLMICAVLLAVLAFPPLPIPTRYVVELLFFLGILSVAISGLRSRRSQPAGTDSAGRDLATAGPAAGVSAWVCSLLIGLELAFLILFVYVFRVVFPPFLASVQSFSRIGLPLNFYATNYGDFLAGIILLGACLAVTVFGARGRGTRALAWLVGAIAGLVAGVAAAALALTGQLDAPSQVLIMFAAAVLAGLIAGGLAGQTEAGALGGFWCGLACALVWAAAGMVIDLSLASHLARTPWYGSHMACLGLSGNELAACAVGQDYSIWGRVLLELPILSGSLGVIGGLLGAALTKARPPVVAKWGRALVAPVVFCGAMILLLVARMAGLI
jgi:hypothetical protein